MTAHHHYDSRLVLVPRSVKINVLIENTDTYESMYYNYVTYYIVLVLLGILLREYRGFCNSISLVSPAP